MNYICPVCGYNKLSNPPADYQICPCCGTEFGYDDLRHSWSDLRDKWLMKGAPWFSKHTAHAPNWNPVSQLIQAGYYEQKVAAADSRYVVGQSASQVYLDA